MCMLLAGLAVVAIAIIALYAWPLPRTTFNGLYEKTDPILAGSLQSFRAAHPARTIAVDGAQWEYTGFGDGAETVLFLHGMTGAHDIWWSQMQALGTSCRVVSVTYPAVDTLSGLAGGVLAILDAERITQANVVGSSLGGYLAQYLVAKHPEKVRRAVFANTFPPNSLIAAKNKSIGAALPFLPQWLVIRTLRGSFASSVYPASGNDELTLAFLGEIGSGRMGKAQVLGRFKCVVEQFTPPDTAALGIPVLIIESDNDPLVEPELRERLKRTYPSAKVHTFPGAGHFPYLNRAAEYTRLIAGFVSEPCARRIDVPRP
jgi:maspardin